MECNYTIRKQDVKKYLRGKHRKINIVCILFFILLFILINLHVFVDNKGLMTTILGCTLVVIMLLIYIVNKLYIWLSIRHMEQDQMTFGKHHVIIDQHHIEDTIKKHKISFKWKDVKHIKITGERIEIKPKEGNLGLVLEKNMVQPENFKKLANEIQKYK